MPTKKGPLTKRELKYLLGKLRTLDVSIMCAFVVKVVEENEATHINYYKVRKELWQPWRSTEKLEITGTSFSFFPTGKLLGALALCFGVLSAIACTYTAPNNRCCVNCYCWMCSHYLA